MRLLLAILFTACSAFAQTTPYLYVVNKNEDTISIVNTKSLTVEHTVKVGGGPHEVAIAPNGTKAYVANAAGNSVSVVDLKTRMEKKITGSDFGYPHGIAFTPDSRRAIVTNENTRKIVVIDAATDQVMRVIPTDQGGTHMVVINKAGTWAYFTNREANTVSLMDLQDYRIVANIAVGRGGE
jgi:YVTN family beta-propeller protein